MATPLQKVYQTFLSKILEDEWQGWSREELEADLEMLLSGAVTRFKFPRKSLEWNSEGFIEDLDNEEIQILACYMKVEWLNRTILCWENVKPLYEERDFSQANLLDKFDQMLKTEQKTAAQLEAIYYRSIKRKPFAYRKLAEQGDKGIR